MPSNKRVLRKKVVPPIRNAASFSLSRRRFSLWGVSSKRLFDHYVRDVANGNELADEGFRQELASEIEHLSVKRKRVGKREVYLGTVFPKPTTHEFIHLVEHALLDRAGIRRNSRGILGEIVEGYIQRVEFWKKFRVLSFAELKKIIMEEDFDPKLLSILVLNHFNTRKKCTAFMIGFARNSAMKQFLKILNDTDYANYLAKKLSKDSDSQLRNAMTAFVDFAESYKKRYLGKK